MRKTMSFDHFHLPQNLRFCKNRTVVVDIVACEGISNSKGIIYHRLKIKS